MRHKNQKKPTATGRIRIIAGQHRGRQLPVLDAVCVLMALLGVAV